MSNRRKKQGLASGKLVMQVKSPSQLDKISAEASGPVIIDFWAPWCGPCKAMAPIFEAAARQHRDRAVFVKVNTEASPALSRTFNIRSIPTLVILVGGEIYDVHIGLVSPSTLASMIRRATDKEGKVGWLAKVSRLFGATSHEAR
jgi:thioredoxin